MKKNIYTLLLALAVTTSASAQQYDFKVGQIYYKITDATAKTVTVTSENASRPYYTTFPTGDLVISEKVAYGVTEYTVTRIDKFAFRDCVGLTSLTIPASVSDVGIYTLGSGSSALKQFIVDAANSYYVSLDGVIYSKDMKTLVAMPPGKTGNYTMPNSVTEIRRYSCTNALISSINFGNSLVKIGYFSLSGCDNIKSFNIPPTVTTIEELALSHNHGLTFVSIPASVTIIEKDVFSNCNGLTTIYSHIADPADITTFGIDVFYYVPTTTCTLYVPAGSKTKYAVADQWKDFTNIVEATNDILYDVKLDNVGSNKLAVISVVRSFLGLGLADAKNLVESAPVVLDKGLTQERALEFKALLIAAGATATLIESGTPPPTTYIVKLENAGPNKTAVIVAIRDFLGLGLAETKSLVDNAPSILATGLSKEKAEEFKALLEAAGATVSLQVSTGLKTLTSQGIQVWGGKGEIRIQTDLPPTPLKGEFGRASVEIYNLSGALIHTVETWRATSLQVPMQPGIYIVRIGNAAEKVVVR